MPKATLKDLSNARILVSNDDGIHAPGLKILERVARSLSKDVWVIAPEAMPVSAQRMSLQPFIASMASAAMEAILSAASAGFSAFTAK